MFAYAQASLHETSLLYFITGNITESDWMGIQGGRGGLSYLLAPKTGVKHTGSQMLATLELKWQ